jgi:hypothetical protein
LCAAPRVSTTVYTGSAMRLPCRYSCSNVLLSLPASSGRS